MSLSREGARDVPEEAFRWVEQNFRSEDIYGQFGSQIVEQLAARASHHPMPVGLALQVALVSAANGVTIRAFPGPPSPVSMVVLNLNYAQVRKSGMNAILSQVAAVNDAAAQRRAAAALNVDEKSVKVKSMCMQSFTEAALWKHAAADWPEVAHPPGVLGRFHWATMMNLDECYKFVKMLNLMSPEKGCADGKHSGDAASEWNRLMQSGTCSHTCKGSGSVGADPNLGPVSLLGFGNGHVSKMIPCLRGETGSHEVASRERMIFTSGPPVEPHARLPGTLQLPPGFDPWVWSPLLDLMLEALGLPEGANTIEVARKIFPKANLEDENAEANAEFFTIVLVDATETLLRFREIETWQRETMNNVTHTLSLSLFLFFVEANFGSSRKWAALPHTIRGSWQVPPEEMRTLVKLTGGRVSIKILHRACAGMWDIGSGYLLICIYPSIDLFNYLGLEIFLYSGCSGWRST